MEQHLNGWSSRTPFPKLYPEDDPIVFHVHVFFRSGDHQLMICHAGDRWWELSSDLMVFGEGDEYDMWDFVCLVREIAPPTDVIYSRTVEYREHESSLASTIQEILHNLSLQNESSYF